MIYCARASRVLEEEAGILTDRSRLKPLWVHSSMFLANRSTPPGPAASVDPRELVARLMEIFRREKPAVVAALEKAAASIEGQELVLAFSPQNRFHGERALKEKDALNERLAAMAAVQVRVSFVEARPEARAEDQRVELLRKVFRGEVVKGEDHGGQPV